MFGYVVLLKDGVQKTGTTTDWEGNYSITSFDPGTYDIAVTYVGYKEMRQTGIQVGASKTVPLNIKMIAEGIDLPYLPINTSSGYDPLIEADKTSTGRTYKSNDIQRIP